MTKVTTIKKLLGQKIMITVDALLAITLFPALMVTLVFLVNMIAK
jgi:hypothetical protein